MTTCLCRSWLPVLTAIIKVPGSATAGKELPPAIIPGRPFPLQAAYREVKDFSPLKPKTYKVAFYNGKARQIVADRFEKLNLVMPQLAIPGLVIQTPRYPDKNNKCKMFMENVLVSKAFPNWKYPADRIYLSKDLLITKTGGKYKIYAASYEAVQAERRKGPVCGFGCLFLPPGEIF